MNLEENLDRYFRDTTLPDTTGAPLHTVVARGRRRRRTRHVVRAGAFTAALALTAGAAVALSGNEEPATLAVAQQNVDPSWFRWETVENVPDGLGPDRSTVLAADGSVYAVSTAPVGVPTSRAARPAVYRSADGTTWSDIELDDGFQASAVGAAGDRVYAIGTAPSGGKVTARLTDLTDASHPVVDLPLDLEERSRVAGTEQAIRSIDLAVHGETVVAVVNLGSFRDEGIESVMPEGRTWVSADAEGVTVIDYDCEAERDANCHSETLETLSWDELGVDPEQVPGIVGESIVFTRIGDGGFEKTRSLVGRETPRLLAADDGFWLVEARFRGDRPNAEMSGILHAADGRSWEQIEAPVLDEAGIGFSAYVDRGGVIDGTALFPVSGPDGDPDGLRLWAAGTDGGRLVDLTGALDGRTPIDVAFGPLGLAIVTENPSDQLEESLGRGASATTDDRAEPSAPDHLRQVRILHTSNLRTFGNHEVEFGELQSPMGLSISADAIVLRVRNGADDHGEPLDAIDARVDLVVGVPSGD